jgi:hypothetical protein
LSDDLKASPTNSRKSQISDELLNTPKNLSASINAFCL